MKHIAYFFIALSTQCLAQTISPGLWEISMDAKMDAAPGFDFPAQSVTRCLSEAETKQPGSLLAGAGADSGSCRFPLSRQTGPLYEFEMSCPGELDIKSKGSATVSPDSISGRSVTTMKAAAGGVVEFKSTLSARRLGPCH